MTILEIWQTYWFFIVIFLLIVIYEVYTKYLKPLYRKKINEKQKLVVRKKIIDFDNLSIENQKKIIQKDQREIKREIRELKLKEKSLLRQARLNKIHFDYLQSIEKLK